MALSHAVPVDQFIKEIYYNLARRTTGPFVEGGTFANPSVKPIPFDLDRAAKMLEVAGWKDTNQDGTLDKVIDGRRVEFKFDLMIFSEAPSYQTMSQIIQENFKKLGIEVQITPTKWALMLQQLRKKEFDATILGWVADWKSDPFQIWHGSQADVVDSSNAIAYQNPEVDKLIEKLRVTMDESQQIEIYHQIHQLLYDDQPYTFLFAEKATALMNSRIQGWKEYPMLRPHTDNREWSASEPRILGP
jgi:ABC-type transport system substrate-binding protein